MEGRGVISLTTENFITIILIVLLGFGGLAVLSHLVFRAKDATSNG